jgi:DNA-binding beta-propeller fold protein YncE
MAVTVGNERFKYQVEEGWGKLPDGWSFKEVAAVAVDHKDNVYCFNRGEHPVIVFDSAGNFLRSWGEGMFPRAHGAFTAPDESLFLTDDGDHTVRKCTLDGKVLLTLGISGKPAPLMSGEPFHRCTHTALSPKGEIYVSDGYGNARVHKYTPDGKLLLSWGEPGTGAGQFNIVHNICCDRDGWVYIADRENHRVQVFDGNGRFETQWSNMARPCALFLQDGPQQLIYVGEFGAGTGASQDWPNIGARVSIATTKGEILAQLGGLKVSEEPGSFLAPHGVAVDSRGNIYVAEVSWTMWPSLFPRNPERPTRPIRTIQKFARLN